MSNDLMVFEGPVEHEIGTALATPTEHPSAMVAADPNNPHALLHVAVARGATPAELEKLIDLAERLEERQARKAYFDAYAKFQAKCPSIKKAKTAEFNTSGGGTMKYTFAPLEEIARTVNPILTECGLSYTWDSKVEGGIITCVCTVRHVAGWKESATIELPTDSRAPISSQQKVGAALTFARRLSLTQALGITTADEDTDGRDDHSECITDEQVDTLQALAEEVGANIPKFLKYCGVASLKELPAKKFKAAVETLEKKRQA